MLPRQILKKVKQIEEAAALGLRRIQVLFHHATVDSGRGNENTDTINGQERKRKNNPLT